MGGGGGGGAGEVLKGSYTEGRETRTVLSWVGESVGLGCCTQNWEGRESHIISVLSSNSVPVHDE